MTKHFACAQKDNNLTLREQLERIARKCERLHEINRRLQQHEERRVRHVHEPIAQDG